jgi:hypothetical protein
MEASERQHEGFPFRQLNFSEISRYGLILVLAAWGERYQIPGLHEVSRVDSARRYRGDRRIESAIRQLLEREVEP